MPCSNNRPPDVFWEGVYKLRQQPAALQGRACHSVTAVVARGAGARQVVSQLVQGSASFVSARLMACLLLVDFWNPVYSAHRLQLMDFVPVSGDRYGLIRV